MPPRKTKMTTPTPVEAITHEDKRANLPTADAHDFITPEVERPMPVRYPRDPTLDPQLVWKGKDALDGENLVADAPAIYIQEKIDPRVLIENLRRTEARPEDEPELTLFEAFDGLGDFDLVDFYRHEANWSNRMILGDSLNVMASLAERESLRGKVQMIYIDPPYGIKFGSNWQSSARKRDVKDGKLAVATHIVIWYASDRSSLKYRQLYLLKSLSEAGGDHYRVLELSNGETRPLTADEVVGRMPVPDGARAVQGDNLVSQGHSDTLS